MSESVIYTAIFGGYDELCDPIVTNPEFVYICFTDDKDLRSNKWNVQIIEPYIPGDSCRSARYVKINAHKFLSDFEYSMYVDGNMLIKDIPDIPKILGNYKFAIEPHTERNCIYGEAVACKELGKDDPDIINAQMEAYRDRQFPEHAGLYGTGLHFKQHNDSELIKRCELWWLHIITYSFRDQLSFPVAFNDYPIRDLSVDERNEFIEMTSVHPRLY